MDVTLSLPSPGGDKTLTKTVQHSVLVIYLLCEETVENYEFTKSFSKPIKKPHLGQKWRLHITTQRSLSLFSTKDVRKKIHNDKHDESAQSIVQDEELVQSEIEKEEHRHNENS